MNIEIRKEDWKNVQEQLEIQHRNALLALAQDEVLLEFVEMKIKEYKDEDPMPEDLKKVIKEVKK